MFGKYVDKCNRMRIKYTRQIKFCINVNQLLNIKCHQYEKRTPINDLDIGHQIGKGYGARSTPHFNVDDVISVHNFCQSNT